MRDHKLRVLKRGTIYYVSLERRLYNILHEFGNEALFCNEAPEIKVNR